METLKMYKKKKVLKKEMIRTKSKKSLSNTIKDFFTIPEFLLLQKNRKLTSKL